ncbi:MAG: USH1C-binding protein 1 [Desulfovibrionales bacterium]|nr:USH1C-binding protein 1 [Desulfovibrionales bacterium]
MSTINPATSLSQIMNSIDLGPGGGIQLMFAKLQMAQSQLCKTQANDYMKQIQDIQEEQKKCADMISIARDLQNKGKDGQGVGIESINGVTTRGKDCYPMPQELVTFMDQRNLSYPNADNDYILGKDEWDYTLKSLTNYQEQIGSKTQTLMVYLQDFIGQYNSFLQGANTAISNANQVLTNIARGQ